MVKRSSCASGSGIRAFVLDRVLRRHDHERPSELVGRAVDRDLVFLHALEQCGLRLRRGPVDLVDEEHVREHRAGAELELVRALVEDVDAGDVGGQQVGRELDAREGAVERAGERLGQHRLPHAGKVLDDQVPLADQAEDAEAKRLVRRVHDPAEVEQDGLSRLRGLGDAFGIATDLVQAGSRLHRESRPRSHACSPWGCGGRRPR